MKSYFIQKKNIEVVAKDTIYDNQDSKVPRIDLD